jgi:hypothetical protein
MATNWQRDKRWSDRFLPEIKRILGEHLIGEPPVEEDQERNTDLMVLKMAAVRVGCRVRKHSYLASYGNEFTVRSGRPSGIKTELTKVIEGWGDYFFYGFADQEAAILARWSLCDLKVFRVWFTRQLVKSEKGQIPGFSKKNTDGSSDFRAFCFDDFPPEFIIARNWNNDRLQFAA